MYLEYYWRSWFTDDPLWASVATSSGDQSLLRGIAEKRFLEDVVQRLERVLLGLGRLVGTLDDDVAAATSDPTDDGMTVSSCMEPTVCPDKSAEFS